MGDGDVGLGTWDVLVTGSVTPGELTGPLMLGSRGKEDGQQTSQNARQGFSAARFEGTMRDDGWGRGDTGLSEMTSRGRPATRMILAPRVQYSTCTKRCHVLL